MNTALKTVGVALVSGVMIAGCAAMDDTAMQSDAASDSKSMMKADVMNAKACVGFGPQTPRDIDSVAGTNARSFSMAPPSTEMNLCNIHFHTNAEHKAAAFSILAADKDNGESGGYQCAISKNLTARELRKPAQNFCKGIEPGDTVEFHWVHTSCDVAPGPGLGSCLSDTCANPDLRVETQVFTVVNDTNAVDFSTMAYGGNKLNGYHQPRSLPVNSGTPVEFTGSTTGPSYTEETCSPLQVSWSVRPACMKVDINSLSAWCENNVFEEDHAHGVRRLVTNPALLSPIE